MGQWSSPPGAIINKPRRKRTSATGSGVDGEEEMDAATDWYSVQYRTIEWKQQYKDSQYLRRDSECSIVHFAKGNNRRQSNAKSRLQLNKSVCLLHLPMVVITLDGNYCRFSCSQTTICVQNSLPRNLQFIKWLVFWLQNIHVPVYMAVSMRDFCSYLFSDTDGGVMEAIPDAISIDSLERNSKGYTSLGDFILEQESSYMAQEKESELKLSLD
jgi:hypothetical protein